MVMARPHNMPPDLGRKIVGQLAELDAWGYHLDGPAATEPTALAAMACLTLGEPIRAAKALHWLAKIQADDGSLGVSAEQSTPCWPTSLAILAWKTYEQAIKEDTLPHLTEITSFSDNIDRAIELILTIQGEQIEPIRQDEHDSTLLGWPWVVGTHSWVEPTTLHILALQATGHAEHVRVAEAIKLLIDRILPEGGCNYGNTSVLGQYLLPHTQPTGLALLALAGQDRLDGPIRKTIDWLQNTLRAQTTCTSLSFGLLGLSAHGRFPKSSGDWIRAAYHRTMARDKSPYKLAMLALAGLRESSPLIALPRKAIAS